MPKKIDFEKVAGQNYIIGFFSGFMFATFLWVWFV